MFYHICLQKILIYEKTTLPGISVPAFFSKLLCFHGAVWQKPGLEFAFFISVTMLPIGHKAGFWAIYEGVGYHCFFFSPFAQFFFAQTQVI